MPSTRVQIKSQPILNVQNVSLTTDGDVTIGSLLVIGIVRWRSGSTSAITAASITQTAGTATLSPMIINHRSGLGASHQTVIASCMVTGTGSLTLQLSASSGNNFGRFSVAEFTGQWTEGRAYAYNQATGTSTTPATGNVTTPDSGVIAAILNSTMAVNASITEDGAFELIGEDEDGTTTECNSFIDRIITSGGVTDEGSWTVAVSANWEAGVVLFREGGVFPARMIV